MDSLQLLFIATGIVILGSSILVVTSRNLVHAALWLIVTLFGVAVLYTMLNANFLAIVQIVIYIGAIAILFIFAVMLTRKEMRDQAPQLNKFWWLSAFVATMLFILILGMIRTWSGFSSLAVKMPGDFYPLDALGHALIAPDGYVLPFEAASILLLAALIGAVYVAFSRK